MSPPRREVLFSYLAGLLTAAVLVFFFVGWRIGLSNAAGNRLLAEAVFQHLGPSSDPP